MLKRLIFLGISILSTLIASSQIQISNIEEYAPNPIYGNLEYFVTHENREYFIYRSEGNTKISEVTPEGLLLLHDLNHYPSDQTILWYEENSKDIITKENLMYELYSHSIYVTNFVTGELQDIYDFCDENISIVDVDITLLDDVVLFVGEKNLETRYYQYNTTTKTIAPINKEYNENNIFLDTYIYFYDGLQKCIKAHNASTGIETIIADTPEGISEMQVRSSINEKYLLVFSNDQKIFVIKDNTLTEVIDCEENESTEIHDISIKSDKLISVVSRGNSSYLSIREISSCELIVEVELNQKVSSSNEFLRSFSQLGEDFIIYEKPGYYGNFGEFYLIDIENSTLSYLELQTDYIPRNHLIKIGNKIFISTYDDVHYTGVIGKAFSIDLGTLHVERLQINTEEYNYDFKIGKPRIDSTISFYTNTSSSEQIWNYNVNMDSAFIIDNSDLRSNRGLYYTSFITEANEKIYTSTVDKTYITKTNFTETLLNERIYTKPLSKNNYLYFLTIQEDSLRQVKLDVNTDEVEILRSSTIESYPVTLFASENKIINYGLDGSEMLEIYNIDSESYDTLFFPNNIGKPRLESRSGSNFVFKSNISSIYYYTWFNSETLEIKNIITTEHGNSSEIVGGKNGNFLFEVGSPGSISSKIISIIDNGGYIVGDYNVKYSRPYVYNINQSTETMIIAPLPGDEKIEFNLLNGIEYKQYSIDHDDTYYHRTFPYFSAENKVVTESKSGNTYQTLYFTFDEDPIVLRTYEEDTELVSAAFDVDRMAIFHHNIISHKLYIDIYDTNTNSLIASQEYKTQKNKNQDFKILGRIGVNTFAFRYHNGVIGNELYSININNAELSPLSDVSIGSQSSFPNNFISTTNGQIYFTALIDNSRQWFTLDQDVVVSSHNLTQNESINIFPNPSNDIIRFDGNLTSLKIIGIDGKIYLSNNSIKENVVDINSLPPGMYILEGILEHKKIAIGKFTVVR